MGLFKKGYRCMGGVNAILLLAYTCAIFAVDFYFEPERKLRYALLFASFFIVCPLTVRVLQYMHPFQARGRNLMDVKWKRLAWFLGFFLLSLALLLVWYFAYYPLSVINDTYDQYAQILSGRYSDWHPVLHTLLVLKLPLCITGTFSSVIPLQMLAFALTLAYMADTLLQYGNLPYALLALSYILLNPNTGSISTYPTKDVTFAIGALLLVTFGVRIWITRGKWLENFWRLLGFAAVLVVTTIVRHNAVLFTLPFFIAVLLIVGRTPRVRVLLCAATLFVLIKGILYPALGVEKPGLRLVETFGLPMTVISSVAKENPECLDDRSQAFVNSVAPAASWADFTIGSFNSNKWMVNLAAIDEAGAATVLHTAWNCFCAAPNVAFDSLFTLTKFVYSLDGSSISRIRPHVSEPLMGNYVWFRHDLSSPRLRDTLERIRDQMEQTPLKYGTLLGAVHFVVIAFLLGRTDFQKRDDCLRMLLCLPLLIHNFGTMLLLSGEDFRFFYLSFPLCPVIIFLLVSDRDNAQAPDQAAS